MTREEEILEAARTRAERHQIAEMELYRGDRCNYSYGRIYNSEIASFEAGAKYADEHPKSPWISVNDDLPCNHKELMDYDNVPTVTRRVITCNEYNEVSDAYMYKSDDKWIWISHGTPKYWCKYPDPPKGIGN